MLSYGPETHREIIGEIKLHFIVSFYRRFHKFGYNMLSYSPDTHREVRDGLPDPRTEYFKFIQARHPLERLASGYISRVKGFGDVVKASQIPVSTRN